MGYIENKLGVDVCDVADNLGDGAARCPYCSKEITTHEIPVLVFGCNDLISDVSKRFWGLAHRDCVD